MTIRRSWAQQRITIAILGFSDWPNEPQSENAANERPRARSWEEKKGRNAETRRRMKTFITLSWENRRGAARHGAHCQQPQRLSADRGVERKPVDRICPCFGTT